MLVRRPFSNLEGYTVPNAGLFDGSTGYLSRTPGSTGNVDTWTVSLWMKPSDLSTLQAVLGAAAGSNTTFMTLYSQQGSTDYLELVELVSSVDTYRINSDASFRDPIWMHVVIRRDSTDGTAANRERIYVNRQLLSDAGPTNSTLNQDGLWNNSAYLHTIGALNNVALGTFYDGYMTEIAHIDGQSLDPSSFGEDGPYGSWLPKNISGLTFGINGFWIKDPSTGVDSSGNGNDFTVTGTITQVSDTPTDSKGRDVGNYATLNPLEPSSWAGDPVYSNGNKTVAQNGAGADRARSTLQLPQTGKWYFEGTLDAVGSGTQTIGVCDVTGTLEGAAESRGYQSDGNKTDTVTAAYGAAYTTNDVIGIKVDMDAGTIEFLKNNTSQGTAFSDLSGIDWFAGVRLGTSGQWTLHFADDELNYSFPTGYKTLATQNLPESTAILSEHMATVLYTGNGSTQTIDSGLSDCDVVWIKNRDTTDSHHVFDTLRGATNFLITDSTSLEQTDANSLTAFSGGTFDLGTYVAVNTNTENYVAWCFSLPSNETNSSGTVSVNWKYNATLGMAIGTYTGNGTAGATLGIPSAFGKAPFMVTFKNRTTGATGWYTWHLNNGAGPFGYLYLNSTDIVRSTSPQLNGTAPTSSVITLGSGTEVNTLNDDYIVVCFFETDLCKPIAYTGNGNADGPLAYTEGLPEWLMVKSTDAPGESWYMWDASRDPHNPTNNRLVANLSAAEVVDRTLDRLSTGFKPREANNAHNGSGYKYVGVAFVNPLNPKGRGQARGVPN